MAKKKRYSLYTPFLWGGGEQLVDQVVATSPKNAKESIKNRIIAKKENGHYFCYYKKNSKKIALGHDSMKAKSREEAVKKCLRYRIRVEE